MTSTNRARIPRTVADIMTHEVISVSPDASIEELASVLSTHGISSAPVVEDDGRVLGMVSVTDILWLGDRLLPLLPGEGGRRSPRDNGEESKSVRELMTPDVFGLASTSDFRALLEFFARTGLHRAPVLDDGRLIGMVSASDVIALIGRRGRG